MTARVDVALLDLVALDRPVDELAHVLVVLVDIFRKRHVGVIHSDQRLTRVPRQLSQRRVDTHELPHPARRDIDKRHPDRRVLKRATKRLGRHAHVHPLPR